MSTALISTYSAERESRRNRPPLHIIEPSIPFTDPHDYSVRLRFQRLTECNANPMLRMMEMRRCKESVVYFVNSQVWTCDQRSPEDIRDVPFDLFAIQMEYLLWIKELQSIAEKMKRQRKDFSVTGLCEKSRGQGASWLAIAYAVHGWLFSPGFVAGFGSLKKEEVDQIGNLATLLEKARYIIRALPAWMVPEGYDELKHATLGKILNPKTRSAIIGEWGENQGRGGKTSIYFLDEAAHLENSKSVDAALTENSSCKIHISTPKGASGSFYEKRMSGLYPVWTPQGPVHPGSVFILDWHDDPRKDEAWRVAKMRELNNDPVLWAQEYDRDYSASLENICIPSLWVRAAVDFDLPKILDDEGNELEDTSPKVGGLDCSGEGANLTVLTSRRGPKADMPVSWHGLDTTQSAHRATGEAPKLGITQLQYDVSGLGIGYKSAWNAVETPIPFKTHAINTGLPPTDTKWPDGKMSKELFVNKKIEFWWMLRMRFEKTYEHRNGMAEHPRDELISIPNHPQLIAELSAPRYFTRETGKKVLESKKELRSRGVKSPDFAESLVLCFAPLPKKKKMIFW